MDSGCEVQKRRAQWPTANRAFRKNSCKQFLLQAAYVTLTVLSLLPLAKPIDLVIGLSIEPIWFPIELNDALLAACCKFCFSDELL
jgi:hypothetical protein